VGVSAVVTGFPASECRGKRSATLGAFPVGGVSGKLLSPKLLYRQAIESLPARKFCCPVAKRCGCMACVICLNGHQVVLEGSLAMRDPQHAAVCHCFRASQQDLITETKRMHLVLFGMQNRTFLPYWQQLVGSPFQYCLAPASFQGTPTTEDAAACQLL
jgi:hypothetical protein